MLGHNRQKRLIAVGKADHFLAAPQFTVGTLTLSVVDEPDHGDQVVDRSGARIFLDSQAAELLDDKELDAGVDASGAVQFAVADQLPR